MLRRCEDRHLDRELIFAVFSVLFLVPASEVASLEKSKVKGPFAPIRVGLIEHMLSITPMECKVYLTQHLMATRIGEDRGKVFTSIRAISKLTGHKREIVKKALDGLEEKDYLKPIDGGWPILNFNGDNPAKTSKGAPKKRACPKSGHAQKPATPPAQKVVTPLPNNRSPHGTKTTENKGSSKPLEDKKTLRRDDQEVESVKTDSFPESWPSWYRGIGWDKKGQKVTFNEEAKGELSQHLKQIADEENLRPLTRAEGKRTQGRLNGYLLKPQNSRCRGPKSLAAIVVNWFENDLRDANRFKSPGRQTAAESYNTTITEQFEDQRPDNAEEIAACEKEHGVGVHQREKLKSGTNGILFCKRSCGYVIYPADEVRQ